MSIPDKFRYRANAVNICVDTVGESDISGRLYHCYSEEGEKFCSIPGLLEQMEHLFDSIQYPQSMVRTRTFLQAKEIERKKKEETVRSWEEVQQERGSHITFFVAIDTRLNANWQGIAYCVETDSMQSFSSELALIDFVERELKKL